MREILQENKEAKGKAEKDTIFRKGQSVYVKILDKVGNEKKIKKRYKDPYIVSEINNSTGNCKLVKRTQRGRQIKGTIRAHVKQLKLIQEEN